MGKFIKFERMVTPIIIQIIFWLGFIGAIIGGLITIGSGFLSDSGGFLKIMLGLLSLIIGPISVRIFCEMLIVVFKMQGALIQIRDLLAEQQNGKSESVVVTQTSQPQAEGEVEV